MPYSLRIKDKNSGRIFYEIQNADNKEDAVKDAMIQIGKEYRGVHLIEEPRHVRAAPMR